MFVDEYGLTAFGGLIATLLVLFLLTTPFIAWSVAGEIYKCRQMDSTNISHEWSIWTGCRVQRPNGMWTHIDDYYTLEHLYIGE